MNRCHATVVDPQPQYDPQLREERNLCRYSRLALPEREDGRLLIAMMQADPILSVRDHNQDDVTGFIRLNALRPASGIAALVHGKKK
jgi:hypothetical protein